MYNPKPTPITAITPGYQPPVPNVRIRPLASQVSLRSVFAPIYTTGPCMSCGNSK